MIYFVAGIVCFVALVAVDRWHAQHAWRIAGRRAQEIMERKKEMEGLESEPAKESK